MGLIGGVIMIWLTYSLRTWLYLTPSIDVLLAQLPPSRTNDNVNIVELSPPLVLWKQDLRPWMETLSLSLNNNFSTAQLLKVTKAAIIGSWTKPSSMLSNSRFSKWLNTQPKLMTAPVPTKKSVTFKFPHSLMSLSKVPQPLWLLFLIAQF